MKDTHNIRIDTTLREKIRVRGAHNGFAWTRQMTEDLQVMYSTDPAPGDDPILVLLKKHAATCGITVSELLERCASVLQIQAQTEPLVVNATKEQFESMVAHTGADSIPAKFPAFNFAKD
jgi:hypothetical protein